MTLRAWTIGSVVTPVFLTGLGMLGCATHTTDGAVEGQAAAVSERAADATGVGPLQVTSGEYKLPASVDPDILGDRMTEVWARVDRPKTLNAGDKHPVLVFLHGNHGTCGTGSNPRKDNNTQYTTQGTCPAGYVVTPNHLGYTYIAERLASWGYVVVSINANRGITAAGGTATDGGLNLARGNLVLKHLQLLSQWNKTPGSTPASLGVDLAGTLDFGQVGMMGHSRGGEGVRAALVQYSDPGSPWPARIQSPLSVKGIFEIGPVDGQTSRVLTPTGTAWNVILPMCDGDVSDLEGMKPFDRVLAANNEATALPKGMFGVWGANHNFFNTEWQESDSRGCKGAGNAPLFETSGVSGSAKQQTAGLHALMGFFRANVGAVRETGFNKTYDPTYGLPESLESVTRIGRIYNDSASSANTTVLENFTGAAGTSLGGQPTVAQNVTAAVGSVAEHDKALKAVGLTWTTGGADSFYEIPFAGAGVGVDATRMETLDLRASLKNVALSTATPTSFSIQLVNADGSASAPVSLKSYLELVGGGHVILESARIPLKDFHGANLSAVHGIRFVFDDTAAGAVWLANVRLSRPVIDVDSNTQTGTLTPVRLLGDVSGTGNETVYNNVGNRVVAARALFSKDVELELESAAEFTVTDLLPTLTIGDVAVQTGRYNDDGDTHRLVFTLTADQFAAVKDDATMTVRYGTDTVVNAEWSFGKFSRSLVTR